MKDFGFMTVHIPERFLEFAKGFVGSGEFLPRDKTSPVGLYHQSIIMFGLKNKDDVHVLQEFLYDLISSSNMSNHYY